MTKQEFIISQKQFLASKRREDYYKGLTQNPYYSLTIEYKCPCNFITEDAGKFWDHCQKCD